MVAVVVRFVVLSTVGIVGTDVEVGASVGEGLGTGVSVGMAEIVCETWTKIVAATSVRIGFKSRVGVLAGARILQADNMGKHRNNPSNIIFWVL